MTFTNFRRALVLPLLFISQIASAGIIDTDRDSFIDDTTSLEWLDINMTTNKTYDYVVSNLGQGQEYEGWRLPNFNEVVQLIIAGFYDKATRVGSNNLPDAYAKNSTIVNSITGKSAFDDSFDAIGYGRKDFNSDGQQIYTWTNAWFTDNNGGIGIAAFHNYFALNSEDRATITLNLNGHLDNAQKTADITIGTLLVKGTSTGATTQVSEPASIFVFTLGLMALGLRRFNKTKAS